MGTSRQAILRDTREVRVLGKQLSQCAFQSSTLLYCKFSSRRFLYQGRILEKEPFESLNGRKITPNNQEKSNRLNTKVNLFFDFQE